MLPQGLLFSSDQQVAELILGLLPEFGIEVEHRADVFSAIEKLTGRSYHVLVVDFKEPLEASFLLKTARELTVAKSTPAVAIVDQQDVPGALKLGASAVLVRPFTFEQARSTFAACLPELSAGQPSPSLSNTRQTPAPDRTPPPSAVDSSRAERKVFAARKHSIPAAPSFAGYTRPTNSRSFSRLIKPFTIFGSLFFLAAIGGNYKHIESGIRALVPSAFTRNSRSAQVEGMDQDALPPIAFEDPSKGSAGDFSTAAKYTHTNSREISNSKSAVRSEAVVQSPSSSDASIADADPNAVHSYIPGSLMVSLQAMTGRAPETKLTPAPNRWSLEPTLLPEEVARQLLVRQVPPKYPDFAAASGLEGVVTLRALVGKDGVIHDLKLIRGSLLLGRSAFDAVRQWQYKPYRVNGEAIEMQTFITVSFVHSPHSALAQKIP